MGAKILCKALVNLKKLSQTSQSKFGNILPKGEENYFQHHQLEQ